MKDRQPGAPGQYKAVITAAELQKLQAGDQFTITLTRDDQPLVEGTPYNKASVLPDDLAAIICPDVLDPTPADALGGLAGSNVVITLQVSGWSDNQQTVAVAGVRDKTTIFVSPETSDENYEAYTESGVRCSAKGSGALIFKCSSVPTRDLIVNVALRV